ncbi:hypothetical protein LJR225_004833 [Phenylobacterium sp. LjRoot225]|uniref:hypothetical protein n=1 Tax=Phenylobacterium sp. LjRoot225 TaxID=3342285 RepID=UPI003ECC98AA
MREGPPRDLIRLMPQAQQKVPFAEQGRLALSVRLPKLMHHRMRFFALQRGQRVNDLYQEILEEVLDRPLALEPFLRAPPSDAEPVTLWFEPEFMARFRRMLEERRLTATNVVLSVLLEKYGPEELLRT